RRDVLPLAGLELLFETADDAQLAVSRDLAYVAGSEESVLGERRARGFGIFEISRHAHRAADQQFAIVGEFLFHAVERPPTVPCPHLAGGRQVRDRSLRHAISLGQVQPQFAVPDQNLWRQRRRAASRQPHAAQAELVQNAPPDDTAYDRNAQQPRQLVL